MKQFAFLPIRQYGACEKGEGFSAVLDRFYTLRDRRDAMRQKGGALRKTVSNRVSRLNRKMAVQQKELEATYDRERLRQLGDIVTANIHAIKKGETVLKAEDFYDENMPVIEIPYHFGDSEEIVPGGLQISPDEARITGDEKALLYLAKTLLALRHEEPGSVRQIHSCRAVLRIVYGHAENGRNINDCL